MELESQGTPWVIPDLNTLKITAETVDPMGGITARTISPTASLHPSKV